MRLSDVLSKAPDNSTFQIEPFLGTRRVSWGQHKKIRVGKVALNYFCLQCEDNRTFMSGDELSCLVAGEKVVSVDASLRCAMCNGSVEAWFLVECEDSFFSAAPYVHLERFAEQKRDSATRVRTGNGEFEDLLERAQIAHEHRLGAGSMVYLRKAFETITTQVAEAMGIPTTGRSGRRKPFRALLTEVDGQHHIIPSEFSTNSYKLFSELSEVIHGPADESEALRKYAPCRRLVLGIIDNVRNSREMTRAVESLGWNKGVSGETVSLGVTE